MSSACIIRNTSPEALPTARATRGGFHPQSDCTPRTLSCQGKYSQSYLKPPTASLYEHSFVEKNSSACVSILKKNVRQSTCSLYCLVKNILSQKSSQTLAIQYKYFLVKKVALKILASSKDTVRVKKTVPNVLAS